MAVEPLDRNSTVSDDAPNSISRRGAFVSLLTAGSGLLPVHSSVPAERSGLLIEAADYGVVADGMTDNALAMARTFAAMSNGAQVRLPVGIIALGSPNWPGLHLRGLQDIRIQGNGATLRWLAPPTQATGPFGPTGLRLQECRGATICDLKLDGNGIDCIGLGLDSCVSTVISNVEAFAHGGKKNSGLGQLVSCRGSGNSWLSCKACDSTPGSQYRGFYLGNGNSGWGETDLRIQACSSNNNDATGFAIGSIRLACIGCVADNNAGAGFISGSAAGSGSTDHLFVGNISRRNAFHGWQTDVYGPVVERIVLSGNDFSGNAHCGAFCHKGSGVRIYGNIMTDNGGPTGAAAVEISMSDNVCVSDNFIQGDAAHGSCISTGFFANRVHGLIISNNHCIGSKSKTVWLEARDDASSLESIIIAGNRVTGGSHGLYMATAAGGRIDEALVSGNLIDGASVTSYHFADYKPGQSSHIRLTGNGGGQAAFDAHFTAVSDEHNCWNVPVGRGSAPPSMGYWQTGATVYNSNPSPGAPVGWICTASGTPGSWHGFGLIAG